MYGDDITRCNLTNVVRFGILGYGVNCMVVRIYKAILDEDTQEVLWPEVRPYRWLMKVKDSMADYRFDLQFNNDASTMLGGRYLEKWLKYIDVNVVDLSDYRGIQYADPATSIEEHADYFAIATGGINSLGELLVFDCEWEKVSPADHMEYMLTSYRKWIDKGLEIDHVFIEEVGTQQGTTQRLITDLRAHMPIEAHKVSKSQGNKELRIDKCVPFIKNGQTKFLGMKVENSLDLKLLNNRGLGEFLNQYRMFPRGNDDVLDAICGLITKGLENPPLAFSTHNPQRMIVQPGVNPHEREILRETFGDMQGEIKRQTSPRRLFDKSTSTRLFR